MRKIAAQAPVPVADKISSIVIAVRNPRPPRLTAKMGMSRPADGARGREQRAVAAQHDDQLRALRQLSSRGMPSVRAEHTRRVSRIQARRRRRAAVQPGDQLRHDARRGSLRGLEMMPTVSMFGRVNLRGI